MLSGHSPLIEKAQATLETQFQKHIWEYAIERLGGI
jgi:hypothetical protein